MSKYVFYSARTQFENMGDLIINKVLVDEIKKKHHVVIDISGVPEYFIDGLQLTGCEIHSNKFSFYKRLFCLLGKNHQIYLVGKPGHIFYAKTKPTHILHFFICFSLWCLGVKHIRIGASLGPFGKTAEMLEKIKSRFYKYIGVRDHITLTYSQSIGMKHVSYCPDLGLGLKFNITDKIYKTNRKAISYSFRSSELGFKSEESTITTQLTKDLCLLKRAGYQLKPVVQVELDKEFMALLGDNIASQPNFWKEDCKPVEFIRDGVNEVLDTYRDSYVVLSNRLHVLIFALAQGAIAIPYIDKERHSKITGIFETLNLDFMIYDIKQGGGINEHIQRVKNQFSLEVISRVFVENKKAIEFNINDALG